jgi:hypothetical protein
MCRLPHPKFTTKYSVKREQIDLQEYTPIMGSDHLLYAEMSFDAWV